MVDLSTDQPIIFKDQLKGWSFETVSKDNMLCTSLRYCYFTVQGTLYSLSQECEDLSDYRDLEQNIVQTAPDFDGLPEDYAEEHLHNWRQKWAPVLNFLSLSVAVRGVTPFQTSSRMMKNSIQASILNSETCHPSRPMSANYNHFKDEVRYLKFLACTLEAVSLIAYLPHCKRGSC